VDGCTPKFDGSYGGRAASRRPILGNTPKLLFALPLFSLTWAEIVCILLILKLVMAIHVSRKDLYLHFLATSSNFCR
jgi:hypothetical protein